VAKRVKRIFISYASADKVAAETITDALEAAGMRCYLAHRDNRGGTLWDQAILEALDGATALVLVLSEAANSSPYVKREVERAASRDIPIAPFRITEVEPGRSLEFFIKIHHWMDVFPPPLEPHLSAVVGSVEQLFKGPKGSKGEKSSVNVYPYMVSRGPAAHEAFTTRPGEPWDKTIRGNETIENLRAKLLAAPLKLKRPIDIKVRGTLFPCALLSSGWWERRKEDKVRRLQWRDGLQEWLFHGFDLWGPSWDFTWGGDGSQARPYCIAQLGDGDEANSIPVLLPAVKAQRLTERLGGTWGGVEAEVSGVLGHRRHFEQHVDPKMLELFGGLLDYCLWLDQDAKSHVISIRPERTEIYSGYLWKCVAPKALVVDAAPCLSDVYFLWEHTNFASKDALAYGLESLDRKEEQVRRRYGELLLVQKSSSFVPGKPILGMDAVYDMLLGKSGIEI
jgi:hypothetical protein